MLIPGFMAGDASLGLLAGWLARRGYRPLPSGIALNSDCSGATLVRLESQLRAHAAAGERVALVGQSRGGTFARVLAVRHPRLVAGIVTLGSPLYEPATLSPQIYTLVRAVAAAGDLGVPRAIATACTDGDCCAAYRRDLRAPVPPGVGFVSVYTRADGVVDWRACVEPGAEQVEVHGSHLGMAFQPGVYRAVGRALEGFWEAPGAIPGEGAARGRTSPPHAAGPEAVDFSS